MVDLPAPFGPAQPREPEESRKRAVREPEDSRSRAVREPFDCTLPAPFGPTQATREDSETRTDTLAKSR
jgi:hypothetical protein